MKIKSKLNLLSQQNNPTGQFNKFSMYLSNYQSFIILHLIYLN